MKYSDSVMKARMGDVSAFGRIVDDFQDMAVGYSYAILGNIHDAQDAAQEAFLQAFRNLGSLKDPKAFPAWFKRIVYTASLAQRKTGTEKSIPLEAAEEIPSELQGPEAQAEAEEVSGLIRNALADLPDDERVVIVLYHLEEFTYGEIAAFLGITEISVTNRLHRARKLLRKELCGIMDRQMDSMKVSGKPEFKRKVLERVGRVYYGKQDDHWEITPFPSSLRACLKALGKETLPSNLAYARILCRSGASFRLMWDESHWNGGNVDILAMEDDPVRSIRLAFLASGYEPEIYGNADWREARPAGCMLSERTGEFPAFLGKTDMLNAIVKSVDRGKPVIAFGIIGPPEACIITGYEDSGEVLLGWNFFQDKPWANPNGEFDPAGYFRKRDWYPNTTGIVLFGNEIRGGGKENEPLAELKAVLERAAYVMSPRVVRMEKCSRISGASAFAAWIKAVRAGSLPCPDCGSNEEERMAAHGDAMDMCLEGRSYAKEYLAYLLDSIGKLSGFAGLNDSKTLTDGLAAAIDAFAKETRFMWQAWDVVGSPARDPKTIAAFAKQESRDKICELLERARDEEARALESILKALGSNVWNDRV